MKHAMESKSLGIDLANIDWRLSMLPQELYNIHEVYRYACITYYFSRLGVEKLRYNSNLYIIHPELTRTPDNTRGA